MVARARPFPAAMIVNPEAGRASDAERDRVVACALDRLDLEVVETSGRGSAIEVARRFVTQGVETIVAYGGDGLVNEVANAVARTSTALAIVPGGTMNVLARALGIQTDPVKAIQELPDRMNDRPLSVPLGRMDDRYFTFSAGCGFDAEAAEFVENHRTGKRTLGELYFYLGALRVLAGTYPHRGATMRVSGSFGEEMVSMAVVCNAGPYAYFMNRPVRLTPDVDLMGGLDLFALKKMRIEALPFYALRAAVHGDVSKHRDAFLEHDLEALAIESDRPFKRHVDGEPLEAATSARFSIESDALMVYA